MPIAINSTDLTMQPTEHNWVSRSSLGYSGTGHPILPAVREYKLVFNLVSSSDFSQLVNFFNAVSVTGTVVATLPTYGASTYGFSNYSGVIINEIEYSGFFEEHYQEAIVILSNIRI